MKPALREKLKAGLVDFAFDDVQDQIPPFIMIGGDTGEGKTHKACTISDLMPVALLDTELRGSIVVNKFKQSKHPIMYKKVTDYFGLLLSVTGAINYFKKLGVTGAIIIDSASEVQQFAEEAYKQEAQLEKVWPQILWAHIYAKCDIIVKAVRESGNVLILTSKLKEKYLNDKPTGVMEYRTYSRFPYLCDLAFILDPKSQNLVITKNGYNKDKTEKTGLLIPKDENLTNIIKLFNENS